MGGAALSPFSMAGLPKRWRIVVVRPVSGGIGDPAIDGGLMPASAMDADWHLPGECPFRDLAVNGGPGKAGAVENGFEANDPIGVGHKRAFKSCVAKAP